ncbi:NACHT domain-containing protein [Streptomyces phaeochromogenes]
MRGPVMPILTTAATKAASSVAVAVARRLLVAEGPGAGLVDRPVRISARVSLQGEQRRLAEKDVRKLLANLVQRACTVEPGEAPILEGEHGAVVDALARTLLALGELEMDDADAVAMEPAAFAGELRRAAPEATQYLSGDGTALYGSLLELSCLHILNFFTQRSTFIPHTLVKQTRRLHQINARLDRVIDLIPDRSAEETEFRDRYGHYVVNTYSRLRLFGVDDFGERERNEWPLDMTYLSLEVVDVAEERVSVTRDPIGGFSWARECGQTDGVRRVEQAFAGRNRIFVRGPAGCGKTTLIQWLAVTAARNDFPQELSHFNGRVPFVLMLRHLIRDAYALPQPGEFLARMGMPRAAPPGWVEHLLDTRRAILLIDGVDEVPIARRDEVLTWLRQLMMTWDDIPYVITARPDSVPEGWLRPHGFDEFALRQMGREDVRTFIGKWHDAMCSTYENDEQREEVDEHRQLLLDTVFSNPDLARLAMNPLMCALVCALNHARRGYVPGGRKELYSAALSMLLGRRDRERGMGSPESLSIGEGQQIALLQKIAYYLVVNGETETEQDTAIRLIRDALPDMPSVAGPERAIGVLRYLLRRSGVLREPGAGLLDFIHRTFQDYLAAKEAVERRDFGLLARNAEDDQWHDVIRMAFGHASPIECALLLEKLLQRADARRPGRRSRQQRLTLLAASCLEHTVELDGSLRREVKRRTEELIPPGTMEDAEQLAKSGSVLLGLLPQNLASLNAETVPCVVRAASLVGGDLALHYLGKFSGHRLLSVRAELAAAWDRFDSEEYARTVLCDGFFIVDVKSVEQAMAAQYVSKDAMFRLYGPAGETALGYLPVDHVRKLHLTHTEELDELHHKVADGQLGRFRALQELHLIGFDASDCAELGGLGTVRRLSLAPREATGNILKSSYLPQQLFYLDVAGSMVPTGLEMLTSLREVSLNGSCLTPDGWAALAAAAPLDRLNLRLNSVSESMLHSRPVKALAVTMNVTGGPIELDVFREWEVTRQLIVHCSDDVQPDIFDNLNERNDLYVEITGKNGTFVWGEPPLR